MRWGDSALVIDCGTKMDYSRKIELENEIKPMLSNAMINIIVSHQHLDHYYYLLKLLKIIPDGQLREIFIGEPHSEKTPKDLSSSELNGKDFFEVYDGETITKKDATLLQVSR